MIERIKSLIFVLPAIVLALSIHEFAHSFVAYKLGDSSQKLSGRLSINPVRHIDPVGFIMLIFLGFGWAKPVIYDPRNIKENKKLARVLIAMAGPFSNLVLGIIFSIIVGALFKNNEFMIQAQSVSIQHFVFYLCIHLALINFGLCIFNMIPISPLDGSHLLATVLNLTPAQEMEYRRYGMPILLILIFSDRLIGVDLLPIGKVVYWIFGIFSGV